MERACQVFMQMCEDVGGIDSEIIRQADEQFHGIELLGTASQFISLIMSTFHINIS